MRIILFFAALILGIFSGGNLYGQYAPLPYYEGSTAIAADSAVFLFWAQKAEIRRGFIQITDTSKFAEGSNRASFGSVSDALGEPDGQVVSLGDSGEAVLYFDFPISDGPGWDFAVFENGFVLPQDTLAFLELAFVEVSSDGEHFVRFPAISLTSTQEQVGSFDGLDTRKIDNLAGKFPALWGTPFDLSLLPDTAVLDKNNVCCIKIIDVIGNVFGEHYTLDSRNNKINDPFPTPYVSSGFDLDAVGVINSVVFLNVLQKQKPLVYPNPFDTELNIVTEKEILMLKIFDLTGRLIVSEKNLYKNFKLNTSNLKSGLYFCMFITENSVYKTTIIKQ